MGKTLSRAESARRAGMHPPTVRYRVKVLGWSLRKALSTPCLGHGAASYSTTPSAVAARTHRHKIDALYIQLLGHSPTRNEALQFVRDMRLIGINLNSRKQCDPNSDASYSRRLGLSPSTVSKRIRSGWDKERARSTPKHGGRQGECRAHRARSSGLSPNTVKRRIQLGWSGDRLFSKPRK
jgi:hypothetical protein